MIFDALGKAAMMAAAMALAGCATLFGDESETLYLNSEPSGATVSVTDGDQKAVFTGKTPASVALLKSSGGYFGGKRYSATFEKAGYQTVAMPVETKANNWYLFGNLLIGGSIGWIAVDPFFGRMYELSPNQLAPTLSAQPAGSPSAAFGRSSEWGER